MGAAGNFVRSLLFYAVFYTGSLFFVLGAIVALIGSQNLLQVCAHGWARFHNRCARLFLGITVKRVGALTEKPVIYAMKHESMFETIEILNIFDRPAVVAKRELGKVPLWGYVAREYGMIFVDRTGGAKTLRTMLKSVRMYLAEGRPIIIFPEGTRVPHGQRPALQAGFAGLYKIARLPVVPIAMNSGLVSARNSFVKKTGTVTFLVGEEIPAGLDRADVEARVHAAINALNI